MYHFDVDPHHQMSRFDKVIDIFVTDKPIALLFDSNTYLNDDEVEKKKMRVNSIFEIFNGDKYFYPDWFICHPKLVNHHQKKTNLFHVVKNILSRGDPNSVKPLENLSASIDALRDRITSRLASESEYLLYLKLIALISEKIKNSQHEFCYEIHIDDDGINPTPFINKPEVISSDDYNFEYLQSLLSLLSYYTSNMIKHEVLGERLNFSDKCICIVREIYDKCVKIMNESDTIIDDSHKFVYKNTPLSISSLDTPNNHNGKEKKLNIKQVFISHFLGGLASIKAHLHLFEAKRYEILYSIQLKKENEYLDSLTNLMDSIVASYINAFKSSKEHNTKSKLTGYTRFMAQLWRCETNYFIASSLEKDIGESGHQIEAIQRAIFIRKCYNTYRDEVATTFLIGPVLKDRYTKVIVDNDQLYKRLEKTTTYVNERDFGGELIALDYTSLDFNTLLDNTTIPIIQQQPVLNNGLGQLKMLLNSGVATSTTEIGNTDEVTILKNTQITLDNIIIDQESFKIGVLNERRLWLTYLTEKGSNDNEGFIINTQIMDTLRIELDKTIKTLELHSL
jgi:hypothetical protein